MTKKKEKKKSGGSDSKRADKNMKADGKSGRATDTSTARDSTGVDPLNQIDPKSPYLRGE